MDWETVQQYILQYGYLAVGVGTFIDQSGLQAFVIAGGVLSRVADGLSIYGVILAGAAGSFASDMLFYAIGRWRANWLERIVKSDKGRARLTVLENGMHKFAFPLITLGRILPWIGRFVPATAGLRKVNVATVAGYAALGSVTVAAAYGMLGYFAAESVMYLGKYSMWIWIGALVLSIPIAGWLLKRFDKAVRRLLESQDSQEQP